MPVNVVSRFRILQKLFTEVLSCFYISDTEFETQVV